MDSKIYILPENIQNINEGTDYIPDITLSKYTIDDVNTFTKDVLSDKKDFIDNTNRKVYKNNIEVTSLAYDFSKDDSGDFIFEPSKILIIKTSNKNVIYIMSLVEKTDNLLLIKNIDYIFNSFESL